MSDKMLSDQELDLLLANASQPEIPLDFAERFARRIAVAHSNNVIAFPARKAAQSSSSLAFPMAAALAASLIVGIWVGANGQLGTMFATQTETAILGSSNDFAPSGIEDLTAVAEDNKT